MMKMTMCKLISMPAGCSATVSCKVYDDLIHLGTLSTPYSLLRLLSRMSIFLEL
jgi:hypothetical protein